MRFLSNKEKKDLIQKLPKGYEISKKDELKESEDILYRGNVKFLININGKYFPHLNSLPQDIFPSVYVDKGAIPFVAKGADLMRPGIQKISNDDFEANDVVVVRDENKEKAFAIGFALLDSNDMKNQTSGKSLKIYHYIGDKFY